MLRRRAACGHVCVGIFIPQFRERKCALPRNLHRPLDSPRKRGKPRGNVPAVVQVSLAVGEQPAPHLLHRAAVADGGEGVEERQSGAFVVADITRRHERHPRLATHRRIPPQAFFVVSFECHLGQRHQPIIKHLPPLQDGFAGVAQPAGIPDAGGRDRRQRHAREQPIGVGGDIGQREPARIRTWITRRAASITRGSGIAPRQQPTELGIARAIDRPHDQRHGIDRLQMRPDDQLDACLLGCAVRPHDAGERGPIGDGDRLVAECMGPFHQFLGVRSALQE